MNFCFIPSVQHMAAVRIALSIYYDRDIEKRLQKLRKIPRGKGYFPSDRLEYCKLIETKAADMLPSLPDALKTRVSKFIRPIHVEILKWLRDHDFLQEACGPFHYGPFDCSPFLDYKRVVCWNTNGTIDRTQTAKEFVQSKNFDPATRFAMACTYFLEDEVLALWHGDEVLDLKSFIYKYGKNAAMRFWMKRLKRQSLRKTPWRAGIDGYFKNLRHRKYDIPLRISSFFPYLSKEGKKNYFHRLRWRMGHDDDLRLCLMELNEEERMEVVSVFPANILILFLQWPFQSLFMDMTERLWSHMNLDEFESILNHFIFDKILISSNDIDYLGLLKEFWHLSPASYKREIKKNEIFKSVEAALNYDKKNASLSLPETIDELLGVRN